MDTWEGYAYYRCGICNDTLHNRKTCPNRQRMYNNLLGYVTIFFKHIRLI
jgi:hypothetical protein